MKEELIRRLVKIVEEANIAELEITRWGQKVKISKYPKNSGLSSPNASTHYVLTGAGEGSAPAVAPPQPEQPAEAAEKAKAGVEIRSPMVGTFYRAPAPDADPYVQVGDMVQKGQVLCIIEAMKLMNEVEAEFPCRILEILVENAQPVEYNQPLFLVEKI
ncbi:MAG: acetyl-CoA carboxylase biotin carboxyl carrier protein [Calditrichaeota bacterium]|nr:MAG: acetyl-CoA carboxylase biotin carboxyl carrier protein [Calditrichota bacterium]